MSLLAHGQREMRSSIGSLTPSRYRPGIPGILPSIESRNPTTSKEYLSFGRIGIILSNFTKDNQYVTNHLLSGSLAYFYHNSTAGGLRTLPHNAASPEGFVWI
jgi:hypothetical protein